MCKFLKLEATLSQFDQFTTKARKIFLDKTKDYGTAWRILRPSSLTDQLYIKAARIRSIEEKGTKKVNEGVEPEYLGIINYSLLALIQLQESDNDDLELDLNEVKTLYDRHLNEVRELLEKKNHDYGEAWRDMRVSSITDIILMKLLRIRQIEDNQGKTIASEGLASNFHDIINYAVFALIKIQERNAT